MAGERRAHELDGERGARGFAKPHVEIEQWVQAQRLEQKPMTGFGRDVTRKRVVERIGAQLGERRNRGRADEAVEQHRNAPMLARRERGAEDGGKLASAERGRDA